MTRDHVKPAMPAASESQPFSGGPDRKLIYVGGNRYRDEKSPVAELALVQNEGEMDFQGGFQGSFLFVPAWKGWLTSAMPGRLFAATAVLVLVMASSVGSGK